MKTGSSSNLQPERGISGVRHVEFRATRLRGVDTYGVFRADRRCVGRRERSEGNVVVAIIAIKNLQYFGQNLQSADGNKGSFCKFV